MNNKIASILMSIMLVCMSFMFAACSHAKDYYGEWTGNSNTWGQFEMTFNEDGTAEVTILGMDSKGTWVENEDEGCITVTTDDFEDFNVTAQDDQLTFEFSSDTITLDKVSE